MRSVVNRNVVMRRMTVFSYVFCKHWKLPFEIFALYKSVSGSIAGGRYVSRPVCII